ncbi:FAD:protein FMN transferase [Criibacterium bergeronii]|uniref:FAD:protein FMN transferase n=2 Tax=Criibacterium bergeronii TaxID=1871336 RepID=A0A552VBG7_9FIRM|nr:FAD:protein FMN transferase [Criibacterium bergeronii]
MILNISACASNKTTQITKAQEKTIQGQHFFLNSMLTVNILDDRADKEELNKKISLLVQDYEEKFTTKSDTSEVSKISQSAGKSPVKVSNSTYELIQESIKYSELSDGAFDVTIQPLNAIWGIGTENENVPSQKNIDKALNLIDYKKIEFNDADKSIFLKNQGMSIDLGAIAKGYVTDKIIELLKQNDVSSAIINMGGNIYVLGNKNGQDYKVGIRDGFSKDPSQCFCIYKGQNISVVTSGVYERNFTKDGKFYHHILSTKDGYPIKNGIYATSIICKNSTVSDAMSTTVFTLGIEKGMQLLENMEGVEGMIITNDKKVYLSSGLKDKIEITNKEYQVQN